MLGSDGAIGKKGLCHIEPLDPQDHFDGLSQLISMSSLALLTSQRLSHPRYTHVVLIRRPAGNEPLIAAYKQGIQGILKSK